MKSSRHYRIAFILSIFAFMALPARAAQLRTVLSCEDDLPLKPYELVAGFSPSRISLVNQAGMPVAIATDSYDRSASLGNIDEGYEYITVTFPLPKLRFSDGKYRTMASSYTISRLQFSYPNGDQPALTAGWVYIYAVDADSSGTAKLWLSSTSEAPHRAHRYVGSVYLSLNPNCGTDPNSEECSLSPSCLSSSSCGPEYGRLIGVSLSRRATKYSYRINALVGTCVNSSCPLSNISKIATVQRVAIEIGTLPTVFITGPLNIELYPKTTMQLPIQTNGISITEATRFLNPILLTGHEEDQRIYE